MIATTTTTTEKKRERKKTLNEWFAVVLNPNLLINPRFLAWLITSTGQKTVF